MNTESILFLWLIGVSGVITIALTLWFWYRYVHIYKGVTDQSVQTEATQKSHVDPKKVTASRRYLTAFSILSGIAAIFFLYTDGFSRAWSVFTAACIFYGFLAWYATQTILMNRLILERNLMGFEKRNQRVWLVGFGVLAVLGPLAKREPFFQIFIFCAFALWIFSMWYRWFTIVKSKG